MHNGNYLSTFCFLDPQVNLKAKDLKKEFTSALCTTILPLLNQGSSAMVKIGHVGMAKEQVQSTPNTEHLTGDVSHTVGI